MSDFVTISFDLLSQFTGDRGGVGHNIVQFVLASIFWGASLGLALVRRSRTYHESEKLMIWGFSLALGREFFMLSMSILQTYGIINPELLQVVSPPFEHALFDVAIVVVASAFLHYLLYESHLARIYLKIGVGTVTLCYLSTFWWWGNHIIAYPDAKFGQTWCEWLFQINVSALIIFPWAILLQNTKGKIRNAVCTGLGLFFLYEFLKIPDMMTGEVYEQFFAPLRHAFYLMGIPFFGYVYAQDLYDNHQKVKADLIKSEKRYRKLFEDSKDVLYMTTPEGRIADINDAGLRLFGYSREEILNTHVQELYAEPSVREKLLNEVTGKGSIQDYDLKLKRKDGKLMDCLVNISANLDSEGKTTAYQGLIRDVTNERNFEKHLRQTEKMEAMGTLAGGIAHDFNNILTAIIGYAFLASQEIDKGSKAQNALEEVRIAGNRAKELVKQILAFSRRDEQVKKRLQVQVIIIEALKLLRATTPSSIDIVQNINDKTAAIFADPTQILQVLLNLCTNAVYAMRESGVIEIGVNDRTFEKERVIGGAVVPKGDFVELSVSDNGPGMDQQTLKRIFDPFFTTKEVGEGSGMGLSVVHGIVKGHGGHISAESTIGKGTRFRIFFPAVHSSKGPEIGVDNGYVGSERILFVDDEHTITRLAQLTLERFGYEVTTRTNGIDALEKFRKNSNDFDLVITDQSMPGLSGSDLAVELLHIRPDLPIILCTGFSKVIDQKRAKEIGIREFVMKPIAGKKLAKVIRKVLDADLGSGA